MDTNVVATPIDADQLLAAALSSGWQTLSLFGVQVRQPADLFAYFISLNEVLTRLSESGAVETVEAVAVHVDYLAERAACRREKILAGGHFAADPAVILDTLFNIGGELHAASDRRAEPAPEGVPESVFTLMLAAEAALTGWCSREKALVLARTVLQERPQVCVEIGIFGGRSLVPCAAALRHIGAGVIYGIEAWSPAVAIENPTSEGNDEWWSNLDFANVKREFYRFVAATDLTRYVRVIEAPSGRAATLFDQIDFLHIDGSHSMINAAADVLLYGQKVRSGGIIVFDDFHWDSTAPAREIVTSFCDIVTLLKDPESGLDNCAILRRR